jgi:hypothetical protein
MQLLSDIGDKAGVDRTLGNLVQLMIRKEDLGSAKQIFLQQLALGREIPEEKQRGYALDGIPAALLLEGDFTGTRAKFEEALALRLWMSARGLAAESRAALAEVALEEGRPATQRLLLKRRRRNSAARRKAIRRFGHERFMHVV